jgi:PmbA protein
MKRKISHLSNQLTDLAVRAGAAHADALAICDTGDSISVRNGAVESIEREDAQGIGLRAFVETSRGLAVATASTSDISEQGLKRLATQVIAMARISEPDPDAVPPVGAEHPTDIELADWSKRHPNKNCGWNLEQAKEAALECEEHARAYSERVTNSEGSDASFGTSRVAYASSDGFVAEYSKSSASLSVSVIAGTGDGMRRDYAWHRALHASDLRNPKAIAEEAASRAVNSLNPANVESGETNVVFEPRIAISLLGHLAGAINGRAVLHQSSFLGESRGEMIFPDFVNIEDHPNHADGLGNRLFDGEGSKCAPHPIIDSGHLTGFLTDRYAAKRLDHPTTGSAKRGLTGDIGIGPSNLIWQAGKLDQTAILREIGTGLLITELIGFGVNGVTGDYSRGAGGFLIKDGNIAAPVQGITIAGNLKNMFANIRHVGSDLTWFGSTAAPSIAISGMTVAGQ